MNKAPKKGRVVVVTNHLGHLVTGKVTSLLSTMFVLRDKDNYPRIYGFDCGWKYKNKTKGA